MNYIDDVLDELNQRLPELSWKLASFGQTPSRRLQLPPGLFRAPLDAGSDGCIQELKKDIQTLQRQKQSPGALYLAMRIQQKVSVLVKLCQLHQQSTDTPEPSARYAIKELTTRKQWYESLEQELEQLTAQHTAILKAIERCSNSGDPQAMLSLQSDCGRIEKRMTLVKEELRTITGA